MSGEPECLANLKMPRIARTLTEKVNQVVNKNILNAISADKRVLLFQKMFDHTMDPFPG
jgi:hypothetical protein